MRTPLLTFFGLLVLGFIADFALDAFVQLILIYIMINMILGMSLNLVNGFTGQFSLGHAGFMAVGAYLSAFLSTLLPELTGGLGLLAFPLMALLGGFAAAFAGYLVGLPSLRLRGDYLAIVTLGFGEIIRVSLLNMPAVGGARGFYGIPGPTDWDLGFMTVSKFMMSYTHALFWVLACFFMIWRVVRSAHGRAFLSVRDDEIAAEAMGVDTTKAKVRAFVLSSFFAGVAGSIFAHYANYLNPASFGFNRSIDAVIIVVLGGMGSLTGSLVAAVFVTVMPELLRPLQQLLGVDLRMVIYSLCLILLMILRPKGLFGSAEFTELVRKYVRKTS
ncbi:MAG: branched-chain amino acid ABC transporter permease [Bdellovibrio sp.]|jgi:branched-chain amino acid transport system permease protein